MMSQYALFSKICLRLERTNGACNVPPHLHEFKNGNAMITFKCPSCQTALGAADHHAGRTYACLKCSSQVTVPTPQSARANPVYTQENEPTATRQPAQVPCPHCGCYVEMTTAQLNRGIRCPSCYKDFVVSFGIHARSPNTLALPSPGIPYQQVEVPRPPPIPVAVPPTMPPEVGWVTLKISARLISWPALCAGCCGPEQTRRDAHCQSTAYRDRYSRSWSIPYCFSCSQQIDMGACGEAVVYAEHYASVHTFNFWNQRFARAFYSRNQDKMLG
jgi:hypothetical protein